MIQRLRTKLVLSLLPVVAFLAGCSSSTGHIVTSSQATPTSGLHGSLHGGQQPIVGATIQLYAVGTTGDASAATPLLSPAITTDSAGGFDLTGLFTCPSYSTLVYLVATGGNPGLPPPATNQQSSLITALGQCGNPTNITFLQVNEVTTVAAVYALAPFMTDATHIGSGSTDAQALADAFTLAWEYAAVTSGLSPGLNVPAGTTVPTAQINTLADLLSACVNSAGGVSGDPSVCGQLFLLTTPSGGTPATNTITALLHLALNPTLNTAALYNLVLATAPFQPTITEQPPDFGVRLTVPSDFTVSPSSLDFGSMYVSGSTAPQTVTIANNTTHALTVTGFQILGPAASDFTYTAPAPNLCNGQYLLPGSSCQVQVTFSPIAGGRRRAYLIIRNSSDNPFLSIPLSGTGTVGSASSITLSPSALTFSTYNVPQPVTVTNLGDSPLSIGAITFSVPPSASFVGPYTQTNNCGTGLQPQSICTINVTLHTTGEYTTAAQLSGVMTIGNDAPSTPLTVSLSSTASPSWITADSIDFGRVSIGSKEVGSFSVETQVQGQLDWSNGIFSFT